jgi:hypothetical protein
MRGRRFADSVTRGLLKGEVDDCEIERKLLPTRLTGRERSGSPSAGTDTASPLI